MAGKSNTPIQGSASFAGLARSEIAVGGVVSVAVSAGREFQYYVRRLYRAMAYAYTSVTLTDTLPFGEEEFVLYAFDALHVRVQRARREPSQLPYTGWSLPAPYANMLAAIGEATIEAPAMRVVPEWTGSQSYNLTRQQWNDLSMRIRTIEDHVSVLFVDTIERDAEGNRELMTMMPLIQTEVEASVVPERGVVSEDNEQGVAAEAYGSALVTSVAGIYSTKPVDAISAATYLVLGLTPEGLGDISLVHPLNMPGYRMQIPMVEMVIERLTQVKSA